MSELPFEGVTGVIHVGAHKADELEDYLANGIYRVVWVEANKDLYSEIEEAIGRYPLMRLAKFAAGDRNALGELHITNDPQSTSMLELNTHATEYPLISEVAKKQVQVKQIDTWLEETREERSKYNLLNLDVQGYELTALRGCNDQLKYVDYVYTEINKAELYKGCALYRDIDEFLGLHGFKRVATVWCAHGWGDALYSRKSHKWLQAKIRLALTKRSFQSKKNKILQLALNFYKSFKKKCQEE